MRLPYLAKHCRSLQRSLRVGEGIRHTLAYLTPERVGIVHRHIDSRSPRRDLLEARLAAGYVLVFGRVPACDASRGPLGSLGVELGAPVEESLCLSVARMPARHPDFLDALHEVREVFKVGPYQKTSAGGT
jgi:hypothetical protein